MPPRWLDRLERRLGECCVPQLAALLVAMNAAVWAMSLMRPRFPLLLDLDPALVLHGQPWRLITFLFIPPEMAPLWMFFWLYFLYVCAVALEAEWGDFRFNFYFFVGATSLVLASLLSGTGLSNAPLLASLFLAFAALYPNHELLLFFVLPVKARWLAWAAWAALAWNLVSGGPTIRLAVAAGLVNYVLFFGPERWEWIRRLLRARRSW